MDVTLFVCNLPLDVDDRYLSSIFSRYGEVFSAKVIRDKNTKISKCFGFVRISNRDSENAIQHLNGFFIKGKKLVVKYDDKN